MKDCLMRFGKEKSHMEDFVQKGHVYINPSSFFSDCEKGANGRMDHFELADHYSHGKGAVVTIAGRSFNVASPFVLRTGDSQYTHLFCAYLLSDESIERSAKNDTVYSTDLWDEFGDYLVFIHDAKKFCEMLAEALKERGLYFKMKAVEYFDEDSYEGPAGPFMKRSVYRHQEEYRFAVSCEENGPIDDLYLGSLENICYGPVHKNKCLNRLTENIVQL